jgi:hypothetical protein
MPRFKVKGVLERDPVADLWKHTLSKIPTIYGRLAYLAGLRDARTGVYQHHGLAATFGREESKRTLGESHRQVFAEWLALPLAEKAANLRSYLAVAEETTEESQETILTHWQRSGQHRVQFPASASAAERALFTQELDLLIELLRAEPAGAGLGLGSSQPA